MPSLQDVSRLLDVCRQSIVFEDLAGVASCLAAMRLDSDVQARTPRQWPPFQGSAWRTRAFEL